jgi:hypothetical protein
MTFNTGGTLMSAGNYIRNALLLLLASGMLASCATGPQPPGLAGADAGPWFGVHVGLPSRPGLPQLERLIAEILPPLGVNALILEVDYGFAYSSHPELNRAGADAATRDDARKIAALCRAHGIRLIPQFNCLGHQSWGNRGGTFPLLMKYPELDETPWVPASNEGIYCRSWCPLHSKVNEIVFALIDELIDAFEADAFHVGMDEVFLIGDSQCPRCKGQNPAELFAKAVNDYHAHLVKEKKLTMMMWADRLLDMKTTEYNMFESSKNGTAPAIDLIPKDIVLCDWHYGKRKEYPSIPYFQDKGFRVWPSSWNRADAALALLGYAKANATPKMVGHLCTTWAVCDDFVEALTTSEPLPREKRDAVGAAAALRACTKEMGKK